MRIKVVMLLESVSLYAKLKEDPDFIPPIECRKTYLLKNFLKKTTRNLFRKTFIHL